MAFALTEEQSRAVHDRGGGLLVSAAAGSGKTRVLVERLLDQVTGEGADIDDFLVITYTRAAAAELRARIAQELSDRLAERPNDRHLRRQTTLVYKAQISTVHAFCAALLRESGHQIGLDPDFRLCDEGEGAVLMARVLGETLDRQYEDLDPEGDFAALVDTMAAGRDDSLLGVNSPLELSRMEELLRARTAEQLQASGVILHAPDLIRVSPLARIEPGAELTGPCEICGRTEIRRGASVASHCVVRDCLIREGAEIRSFSHLEGARVGEGALVGPFARLRPGAELEAESHVGNFVELKKACLGKGAKANHLSYLGDARIGAGANIGAGTITCNYDGKHKYQTSIGEKAFIGSNTALVAPVSVGDIGCRRTGV